MVFSHSSQVLCGFTLVETGGGKQLSPTVDGAMSALLIMLNIAFVGLTFIFCLVRAH